MFKKVFALTIGLAVIGGVAWAQANPIQDRIANRKLAVRSMLAIKKIVEANGPVAEAAEHAAKLPALHKQFLTMFPAGSDKGSDTKALPIIWTDWAGFEKAAKENEEAIEKLIAATKGNDSAALASAFGAAFKNCFACHEKYHAP